jgi:ATP-dependent Lhr-like helicase
VRREDREVWFEPTEQPDENAPSAAARAVRGFLLERGACFFDEVVRGAGLLRTQVEQALGELAAAGLAVSDSFIGLRALIAPSDRRPPLDGRRRRSNAVFGMANAGRWSPVDRAQRADPDERVERVARALLARYGVVFRRLLDREGRLPPWRDLLRVYRRLEARGEIRGGRFVDGFAGEQFAAPEAVGRLRAVRRETPEGDDVSISAADPLNLTGIVTPGRRVPAVASNRILYRDGLPLATYVAGEVRCLVDLGSAEQWEARRALMLRRVPPQLRAYLGRSA